MSATLDNAVSRAMWAARVLERAVNRATGWEFEYCGTRVPAGRRLGDDRVVFVFHTPPLCAVEGATMALVHEGELMLVRPADPSLAPGELTEWALVVGEQVPA